jgi:LAO/AO transport system kinase
VTGPADLAARLDHADPAAVSRAISLVENTRPGFEQLLAAIHPRTGRAHRVGVTGPPGAGKSTLTQALVSGWRAEGLTVAVVAVDPTSPLTGGALLGDRIRMEGVALDPGVFIRSMATRGALGGLALATREVCDVLDAAGFDRIVVETVGVGQSELDVVAATDTTILVLVPESGDGIQTLKSGLMEVADVLVVNKADRPGADRLVREIEIALGMRSDRGPWSPPVLTTVATSSEGVAAVRDAVERHRIEFTASGQLASRRGERLARQLQDVVRRALGRWAWEAGAGERLVAERRDAVEAGATTPYAVAEEAVAGLSARIMLPPR